MTTTSDRYCNHTPQRITPGPGEATMGRDCLVEAAGRAPETVTKRVRAPRRGILLRCRPAGSDSRALPRAKIAFNSDQWSIKLSIVRESLVNVQWQLLERASSIILEVLSRVGLSWLAAASGSQWQQGPGSRSRLSGAEEPAGHAAALELCTALHCRLTTNQGVRRTTSPPCRAHAHEGAC